MAGQVRRSSGRRTRLTVAAAPGSVRPAAPEEGYRKDRRHGPAERMSEPSNRDAAGAQRRDVRGGCVTLRDLTVGYRERVAVEDVSGVFAAGSLTAIVGANGAGKTTLLHAIAGLVAPRHGSIEIVGTEVPARSSPTCRRAIPSTGISRSRS